MAGLVVPPKRSSDADRDRVVHRLRDAVVDGRLSHDSFVWRVDLALRARDEAALGRLVADLPASGVGGALHSIWSAVERHLRTPDPGYPLLPLPSRDRPLLVVGRARDCDYVLANPTVSRVHAVLMLFGGQWLIHDRRSTNGTRVNGRRIWGDTVLEPGDIVSLGQLTLRAVRPDQ